MLGIRKLGGGQQYEIKWRGQQETTWEAASRVRREIPLLVQEFEQQQQQQQQQRPSEGAIDGDEPMLVEAVMAAPAALQPGAPQQNGISLQQVQALEQLVRDQAQQMREQAQQLQQLRASPAHSPQLSALPSPQLSPQQEQRRLAAAAAAAAPVVATARRKEPRLSDLAEYNGSGIDKLDSWLAELRRCARYYQLNGGEAVEFAVARLRDSADIWWASELSQSEQAAICSVDALAAAMRARFQPVTTARVAREKLHALQQGGRHIDDYIAEFSRLRAQVPDMAEPDARAQFVRGLRRELAIKLEDVDWESMPLAALIAKAARIGGRTAAAQPSAGRAAAVNQMDVDGSDDALSVDDRIAKAVLNAMQAAQGGSGAGMGAKTQMQRGYPQEGVRGSSRGGRGAGRGGRFGGRGGAFASFTIPGVPAAVVEQRRAAGQCFRCGSGDHRSMECPSAPTASQPSF